ncbi:MAG: peptidylprolyl isomerase [Myxococcales bacterium]|nr:peptidylprolyl isomerase [Myxococcales bacterium]
MNLSVNGSVIDPAEVRRETRTQLGALTPKQDWAGDPVRDPTQDRGDRLRRAESEAARALVVRELLRQEARARGLLRARPGDDSDGARQAEEAALRELTQSAVPVPEVSDAECRAYFDDNRDRFRGPDLFEPSHILFAAPADSPEARAQAFTAAKQALAELQRDPERFESLAKKRSACPSGARGGSLGQLTRGETEPPFERHILELRVGAISDAPIETDHGFHIVRLDHRARGDRLPFEVVADRIRIYLRDRAWRKAMHRFIGDLMERATIEGLP